MVTQKLIKSTHELTGLLLIRIYKTVSSFNEHLKSVTAKGLCVKNQVKQDALYKCD